MVFTDLELMLMTSASKQRCPLDIKYLLCRLEVGVQVHQTPRTHMISMVGPTVVVLMGKVGAAQTKCTR